MICARILSCIKMYFIVLCFIGYLLPSSNAGVASFLKPCKTSDEACLISSAQATLPLVSAGIPELGLAPAVPLDLKDVGSNQEGLVLTFRALKVKGIDKCKFITLHVENDKSVLNFDIECPISATGKYNVTGKLLFVPIEGDGDFEINTEKVKLLVKCGMKMIDGADGKERWFVDSLDYTLEPQEKFYIQLNNLFDGDEQKAKPVLEILNHSWKELVLEIGKPIIDSVVLKAKDIINDFTKAIPAEKLFLD